MSAFSQVKLASPEEFHELEKLYLKDNFHQKVNLNLLTYKDEHGKLWVPPEVRVAEKALAYDETQNKDYFMYLGWEEFRKACTQLLLGEDSPVLKENRAFGISTVSGTGALRIGAEFLVKHLNKRVFYYSKPTRENHRLFLDAGFTEAREYRYWHSYKKALDFEGLIGDLNRAPEGAVIILHACAHNPTGCDPTNEQWMKIAEVMKDRKLFPFFHSAYQGFASGDLDKDAWSVRYFVKLGLELFCAQSYSKNFGIGRESIGSLTVVLADAQYVERVECQFSYIVRAEYIGAPAHGAKIILHILKDPILRDQWRDSLKVMSLRISKMRRRLRQELERNKAPGTWNHITDQMGMFCYTGLSKAQSKRMMEKYHIYMMSTGKIAICGLTEQNVEYVALAMKQTLESIP